MMLSDFSHPLQIFCRHSSRLQRLTKNNRTAKDTKSNEVVTKNIRMAFEYQRWRGASVSFSTTLRLCHSSMECRLTGMSPDTSCEPGSRQSIIPLSHHCIT